MKRDPLEPRFMAPFTYAIWPIGLVVSLVLILNSPVLSFPFLLGWGLLAMIVLSPFVSKDFQD